MIRRISPTFVGHRGSPFPVWQGNRIARKRRLTNPRVGAIVQLL